MRGEGGVAYCGNALGNRDIRQRRKTAERTRRQRGNTLLYDNLCNLAVIYRPRGLGRGVVSKGAVA